MDPILVLGLFSIVGGGLFLSLFFHCLVAIIECIGNTVFSPPKSHSPTFGVEDI